MINKINKIKKLGLVFGDYTWDTQLPNFKRHNLIYGWTGTGKTTLSKLFDALESGQLKDAVGLEYEIEDESGSKYKQGGVFNKKVRVFNQDFIENNLKIRDGKAKSITLVLGDVNKEIVEQIEVDKIKLKEKNDKLKKESEQLEQNNKSRSKTFTEIAKTIYVAITGGAIRNYRKDNAETDFASLSAKIILPDTELNSLATTIKQASKPIVDYPEDLEIELGTEKTKKSLPETVKDLAIRAEAVLSQTVESQVIEKLKENQDISDWVETGIKIHADHKSANCEFCQQILPVDRLPNLLKHFNDADKKLKQDVDDLVSQFLKVYTFVDSIGYPDRARLYDELSGDYDTTSKIFDEEKSTLLISIDNIGKTVKEKKAKTTDPVILNSKINIDKFIGLRNDLIGFIYRHNKKTLDFENEKNGAISKLKNHYLSTIFDEINNFGKEIKDCNNEIDRLNNGDPGIPDDLGIIDLQKRISQNQVKISSTHKACEDINSGLATFLGRNELVFEPHKTRMLDESGVEKEIDDGYVIKRGGKIANNLSEGEKTAIAFVYFTIHLRDQNFDLKNGIIVVDDPVSSLDSSSLFQAFAFLKNSVKDAEQIFIFTHNFDFLKLLLNWVRHVDHGNKSGYYMIKNRYVANNRSAYLDKMDKELCEYESEYHYLFKILKQFESNESIAQAYPIPNIARKVLDTFLLFRVPSGGGSYSKLEKIADTTSFDPNKLTAIYKFTNDQSHMTGSGFDPALVPETQKNVKYLLEMINTIFPEHYKILEESIK